MFCCCLCVISFVDSVRRCCCQFDKKQKCSHPRNCNGDAGGGVGGSNTVNTTKGEHCFSYCQKNVCILMLLMSLFTFYLFFSPHSSLQRLRVRFSVLRLKKSSPNTLVFTREQQNHEILIEK